jgi:hypothetical protein
MSHIGGHRFAANMLCLPHGIQYGRVTPDMAYSIVELHNRDLIELNFYRGRTYYEESVQAADHFLRNHTGIRQAFRFRFERQDQGDGNRWNVFFRDLEVDILYRVSLISSLSDFDVLMSCGDETVNKVKQYKCLDIKPVSFA